LGELGFEGNQGLGGIRVFFGRIRVSGELGFFGRIRVWRGGGDGGAMASRRARPVLHLHPRRHHHVQACSSLSFCLL
jgi:hypothetical protein